MILFKRVKSQRGSALVAVLFLIFTAGAITTAALAISKMTTFGVASHLEMQRSMYVSEGVANRVQWLIAVDHNAYPDRDASAVVYDDFEFDRYLADGVPHEINYYGTPIVFEIYDAISGWDMSDGVYNATLNKLQQGPTENADWAIRLTEYATLIADYIDSDDDVRDDGREKGEYEELGMVPLPRNEAMQFREELLYLHETLKIFPLDADGRLTRVRLIPPPDTAALSGTPSLYTADEEILRSYCLLEDSEITEVIKSLDRLRLRKEPLSETLDETILSKLSSLTTSESGYFTIVVRGPEGQKRRPFRRLSFSYVGYGLDGAPGETVNYLEWIYY